MELAYVHDWVAFPTVQIQEVPVKLRVRVLSCIIQKGWVAFPIAQMHDVPWPAMQCHVQKTSHFLSHTFLPDFT